MHLKKNSPKKVFKKMSMSKWPIASNVQPGIVFRDIYMKVYIYRHIVTQHKAEDFVSRGVPPYMNDL